MLTSSGITINVMLVWVRHALPLFLGVYILLAEIRAKVVKLPYVDPQIPNDAHLWPKFRPACRQPGLEQWFHIQCRAGRNLGYRIPSFVSKRVFWAILGSIALVIAAFVTSLSMKSPAVASFSMTEPTMDSRGCLFPVLLKVRQKMGNPNLPINRKGIRQAQRDFKGSLRHHQ